MVEGDATTGAANDLAVATAVEAFDGLDTLVNCVGIFDFYQGIGDIDADDLPAAFDEMFRTNVLSHLQSVKAAAPALQAETGSSIVLAESASSFYPGRGGVLYVSSKFAVRGLIAALAHELAPGIRVNGVAPGGTLNTDLRGLSTLGQHTTRLDDTPNRADDLAARTPLNVALDGADHAWSFVFSGLRPFPRYHRRNYPSRRRIRAWSARVKLDEQRALVAQACRVAAARGLVDGILGHLSLRVDDRRLLVRCRSDTDTGVAFTRPSDIRLIEFDGSAGAPDELDGYRVPNELPIHVETMLADPQHRAVAHLHPPAVVAADLAGIAIRPIYGAYDIPGAWLARRGVPVYERAVLIRNANLGKEMVAAMRGRPIVICRGHGITSAADTVEQAVLQAISLDALAQMSLQIRAAGGTLREIDDADWDDLPDLGAAFTTEAAWRHEVARLGDQPS